MTAKVKTKNVTKCTKTADLTDKIKANTDLGKWWRQFCFNHISIIPGSFPKRRLFLKRPVEESGFTVMIRPPYQIYNVEIVDANARNDFKSRRVDHIVKKMHKSASAPQNGYKEHTNVFKHNASGTESLQSYREMYAYSRHRLAKINRKRLKKVVQMVKTSGNVKEAVKKSLPKRLLDQNREAVKELNHSNAEPAQLKRPKTEEFSFAEKNFTEKIETAPNIQMEQNLSRMTADCDRARSGTASTSEPRSKSILDGLPPGTYTKRITFIKSPNNSRSAITEPLKVTSVDFPDESKVSRKSAPLGSVINKTFTISTKITKVSNEIQGSSKVYDKKDEADNKYENSANPPSTPLLRRLKMPQQQTPLVFKYTEKINSLKSRFENEANDKSPNVISSSKKPSLAKYAYRDDHAENKVDFSAFTVQRLSEKNRQMFDRLTRNHPAKDVIELTQRFLEKHKKK